VNYGVAGDVETRRAVVKPNAELVLLQETNPAWEASLRPLVENDYAHVEFRHAGAAGGMAIFSKYPLTDLGTIDPPERGWFFAWRVRVKAPAGDVQVLNVHLRPQIGDNGSVVSGYFTTQSVREREVQKYFAELEPDVPTIIAGDFNEQPGGEALDWLAQRGFVDALDHARGSRDTWRWNTSLGTLRRELDHVLVGKGISTISAQVIDGGRSDHLPVFAVLAIH
jgi:endonuclease/exonuclease/phosphatase family metal-dependent hydrolase